MISVHSWSSYELKANNDTGRGDDDDNIDTVILGVGNNTGIEVPTESLEELGAGKRPPVIVKIGAYAYRSTPGIMDGRSMIPLAKAHRDAAGLKAGDAVTVTLELEDRAATCPRSATARGSVEKAGLTATFDELAYSKRKEFARQVAEAKTEETRERRVQKVLDALR